MLKKISLILIVLCLSACSPTTLIPSKDNNNQDNTPDEFAGFYEIEDGLYVNYLPGIYNSDTEIEFKFKDEESKLYYTLDFSYPNANISNLYTDPIYLAEPVVERYTEYPLTSSVDAILSWDAGGKCVSNYYIDNVQNPKKYHLLGKQNVITIRYIDSNGAEKVRTLSYIYGDYSIPVVSLSMPFENWFGSQGLYNNIRDEYEKRGYFEYFDPTNNESFFVNTQVKLGGNWSVGYPQRTLNLNFNKDETGLSQTEVVANIFPGRKTNDGYETLNSFSRLRLHNAGNCFESWTGFNDAILQNMMTGTNVATTAYRPCVAFLNGEYWGIYYLREHYKPDYFKTHYGVKKSGVAIYDYKVGFIFNDGDMSDFNSFFNEIDAYLNKDFSKDSVYEGFINKYIDVDSLIDVFIAHSFGGNWDFVGNYNNLKAWRTTYIDPNNPYADGKLRFCLHDADFVFTDYNNFLDKNSANSYYGFKMFKKLTENQQFKDLFYSRAEELIETNLSYEYSSQILQQMVDEVEPYKLDAMKRWGNPDSISGWKQKIKDADNFLENKSEHYLETLRNTLKTY